MKLLFLSKKGLSQIFMDVSRDGTYSNTPVLGTWYIASQKFLGIFLMFNSNAKKCQITTLVRFLYNPIVRVFLS